MFVKVTSAAPDGNVFDRVAMAVAGANEEAAEQPCQVDFIDQVDCIELVHHGNTGNFDQCDLEEAAGLVQNIDDDIAPAPENINTAAPTDTIFQGCGHSGQCKREKDGDNNMQP